MSNGATLKVLAVALAAILSAAPPAPAQSPAPSPAQSTGFPVAVVPSDDAALTAPVERDQELAADQILDMTRRAMDLIGGMESVVSDTARLVVLKPNISIARPSGSGVITDARVVRAAAILVHEAAPKATIWIGEAAGGWISPALRDCSLVHIGGHGDHSDLDVDGFEVAGHYETVTELQARGIDIDVHDLNFDPPRTLQPPGGGLLWDEYDIASSIIDADVWINLPVAKTHGSKITCCMKNHFGILPGLTYGWSKSRGTPDHRGIPHVPRVLDECWVDLVSVSQVDLNIVDMIAGTEAGAFEGEPKRSNLIVAGRDPIATDLVVARLMGFNPDDFEYADLGRMRGMGPGLIDNVDIRGGDPAVLASRFVKAGTDNYGDWGEHSQYGMGPRRWILLGPLDRDHEFPAAEVAGMSPVPGEDGWSPVTWFGYDKINLDKHYDDPANCAVYAFTHFTMAQSDSVRFWIGSDEDLEIWLDGELLYEHEGRRSHHLGDEKIPGYVEAGEHRLLIRAEQGRGRFDFSFNVCEPIDDIRYSGNRYPGVRYYQAARDPRFAADVRVPASNSWDGGGVGTFESNLPGDYDPVEGARQAPDSLSVVVAAPQTGRLVEGIATQFPQVRSWAVEDTVTPAVLSEMPFAFCYMGYGKEGWGPEVPVAVERVLGWVGVKYWLAGRQGQGEMGKSLKGWLAAGRVPLTVGHQGWGLVSAYRPGDDGLELRVVEADSNQWHPLRDWWTQLPGRQWIGSPVLVAEVAGEPLAYDALVDSVSKVALELALLREASEEWLWGSKMCPAGLYAWDEWVREWERLPWTEEWAREPKARDRLAQAGGWFYEELAEDHEYLASFYRQAADRSRGPRGELLGRAAAGFAETARLVRDIDSRVPEERSGELTAEDSARLAKVSELREMPRRAREAERQAFAALGELMGVELPPIVHDPLLRRERGVVVTTWQAELSKGIFHLVIEGDQLTRETLYGRETEGESTTFHDPLPAEDGWEVAYEVVQGEGMYDVMEQPTAANGYRAVVRVDDEWTDYGNTTELKIWAVPK